MENFLHAVIILCLPIPALAEKPNLLIILTDYQGYGDISTYQETDVRTPQIDRLAEEGEVIPAKQNPRARPRPATHGVP